VFAVYAAKYNGYQPRARGFFILTPHVALAWSCFPHDATRWSFDPA